jgi:hypothetical protein
VDLLAAGTITLRGRVTARGYAANVSDVLFDTAASGAPHCLPSMLSEPLGNGQHAEEQHLLHRVADPAGIRAGPERRTPACASAPDAGPPPAGASGRHQRKLHRIEVRGHLLAGNGWKIEGKKAIVAHGRCCPCRFGCRQSSEQFISMPINKLRYIRQPKIIALVNNLG